MKKYICEKCNTEYIAEDKYELAGRYAHINFEVDIEEYDDSSPVNIIFGCDVCYEDDDEDLGYDLDDKDNY